MDAADGVSGHVGGISHHRTCRGTGTPSDVSSGEVTLELHCVTAVVWRGRGWGATSFTASSPATLNFATLCVSEVWSPAWASFTPTPVPPLSPAPTREDSSSGCSGRGLVCLGGLECRAGWLGNPPEMTGEDGEGAGLCLAGCWRHWGRALGRGVDGFPSPGVGGLVVWSVRWWVAICSSSWIPVHNLRTENSWNHTSATRAVGGQTQISYSLWWTCCAASWRSLELSSASFRMRSS